PTVTVVVDTSGSMDEAHLGRVQAELEAVLSRVGLRGVGITALAVDTEVQASAPIRRARQLQLRGGGGTDMAAGIDAAVRSRPRPDVIIVLTDGLTAWPSTPPRGVRVIVGLLRNGSSPDAEWRPPSWARTVLIDQS
ncbi:MAG: hypothetical protein JWO57_1665, partial [Pseudonocardiales bacterium]|nr:hypothetical protein [Pseudonocardiales bacterium]